MPFNNAAERELRAVAVGRKNRTFAGSDEGGCMFRGIVSTDFRGS
ncbi:hypothetical protein ACVI1I_006358 [Bradyrhizobium sp. USDA 4459]